MLGLIKGKKIEPEKHLIIFDEVQECPEALNCLKYFYEKANEYHVIAAGSLLGTLLAQPKSYPVGKVNIQNIYPLDFEEFLCALDEGLYGYYEGIKKGDIIEEINEKFVYGCVREGARAREFAEAIEWLVSAGMVIRIYNVSKAEHPLKAFEEMNHFKLFLFDVGLLKQMAGISNEAVLLKTDYQFKGALTENYCLQQIRGLFDTQPAYYVQGPNSEIDFVVQNSTEIVPIEVKAGEAMHSNSFKRYIAEKTKEFL